MRVKGSAAWREGREGVWGVRHLLLLEEVLEVDLLLLDLFKLLRQLVRDHLLLELHLTREVLLLLLEPVGYR